MPFCNQCGAEYSLGEVACAKCRRTLPQIAPASLPLAGEVPAAPKLKRAVAGAIDVAVAYALVVTFLSARRPWILTALRLWPAFLAPLVYLLLRDSLGGKSVGKLVMGLVVYNEKEQQVGGFFDSISRNSYFALPFVGPTLFALIAAAQILSGSRKRLGDRGASTVVIADAEYLRRR